MEWIKYFETKQEMMEAAGNGNRKRRSEKTDPEVLRDDAQSGKRAEDTFSLSFLTNTWETSDRRRRSSEASTSSRP